jgi:nitroreductase
MELNEVINLRRSYRSLEPVEINDELVEALAGCAQMAPSCFNNQPWRFVFAYDQKVLEQLFAAMSRGNEWTRQASMIIAVFSESKLDCQGEALDYYLFDTGMAVGFLLLKATELGLVAHPIAGFDGEKAKDILSIPGHMTLITLIIVGKKSETVSPLLSENMAEKENTRPPRKAFNEFAFLDRVR